MMDVDAGAASLPPLSPASSAADVLVLDPEASAAAAAEDFRVYDAEMSALFEADTTPVQECRPPWAVRKWGFGLLRYRPRALTNLEILTCTWLT